MKKFILIFLFFIILTIALPAFADEAFYSIIPGRQYNVLTDEILTNNNSSIVRSYTVYSGNKGTLDSFGGVHYGVVEKNFDVIQLPQSFKTLIAAKQWLAENEPDSLRLRAMTLLSESVFNQWVLENYRQDSEYWKLSPKGLILNDIKPAYEIVLKPFVPNGEYGLYQPENPPAINVFIDNKKVDFSGEQLYVSEANELLLPIREIAENLNYKISFSYNEPGQSVIKLDKINSHLEISVWWDYFTVNGQVIKLTTNPRLSANYRTLVPATVFNFMGVRTVWDNQHLTFFINSI